MVFYLKIWQFIAVLVIAVAASLAGRDRITAGLPGQQGKPVAPPTLQREYLPDRIVVKFKDRRHFGPRATATGMPSLDVLLRRFGVVEMRAFYSGSLSGRQINNAAALESIYELILGGNFSPPEVAQTFRTDPAVEYAEPKYIAYLHDVPNDPQFSVMAQFIQVQAPAAWDVVKGEAGQVVIAVVDGGTDWDHEDLAANIWTNPGEIPDNGIDDDGNGFVDDIRGWNFANNSNDPTGLPNTPSSAGHGTHVSGTAAAVTNNNLGVASISWNCLLMPINAASPIADRAIPFGYEGIAYAAANGADVINCSWGGTGSPSRLEQDVIDFAHENGALVVAAAGNDNNNNDLTPHYPSNYRYVLAVGATNQTSDLKTGFSNYGATVDVFAPGAGILSTLPGDAYGNSSGTSMSTPMVAGLAGLVRTLRPDFTADQLREQIRVSSDPIDAVNPNLSGLLGRERVNALRAVTEFANPAIRLRGLSFTDSGGDGVVDAGETIDLTAEIINYLAPATGVNFVLSQENPAITITAGNAQLPAMGTGEVSIVNFQFQVAGNVPNGTMLRFYLDINSGNYSDRDYFTLTVTPPMVADHNTGTVQTSVTTEGNIGFIGFDGTPGVGFVHDGNNYLFEGGLMIGTGVSTVSDCIRGADGSTQDVDFTPAKNEVLQIVSPGQFTAQEGSILLTDSLAGTPLGLSIQQKSYADTRPENQDFIIFQYTLLNNGTTDLSNVHVGLFFDWDINAGANDYARYDTGRRMGYVLNNSTAPTQIAATRLLSEPPDISYRSIHNPNELYDGFTNTEKWSFLSGGIQTQQLDNVDVSTLLTAGPYLIPAGQSIEVVFAVIGAASMAELQQNADAAKNLWENPTAVETGGDAGLQGFWLYQNFPNPFNPATQIRYTLPVSAAVRVEIFNTLGQKVRTLVHARQPAGTHTLTWDGQDDFRQPLPSGVYMYRLKTDRHHTFVRKMLLLR